MSKNAGKVIKVQNGVAVKTAKDERPASLVQGSNRSVFVRMPGRIEVAGNHVDHQGGRALTATVDRFITIHAAPNGTSEIRIASPGFPDTIIDANDIEAHPEERFTSAAIVRGVVAACKAQGVPVGGFDADVTSTIPVGRGLSSSAAYELALVSTIAKLFGGEALDPEVRAKAAFLAEQEYFGKPCGAMDQRAIAYRGLVAHDFSYKALEQGTMIRKLDVDFSEFGYYICLIDTHCDHSLYPEEYSLVVSDMNAVAAFFGETRLGEVDEQRFREGFDDVRKALGDQPVLRAMHYYNEVRLVDARVAALEAGDMETFLAATRLSGASSAAFLQNVSTTDRQMQPAMIALAAVQNALGMDGACRIHGGGFGGTILAFVHKNRYDDFAKNVNELLGEGSCLRFKVEQ